MGDITLKRYKVILGIFFIVMAMFTSVYADDYDLTEDELNWLEENKDKKFTLGLDPYSGMDFFEFRNKQVGYIVDVVKMIEDDLDIDIEIIGDSTWGIVYQQLLDAEIDILFGANVTEERLQVMDFTAPIHRYPYAIFVNKSNEIKTVGDLDQRTLGVIEGDIVIDLIEDAFPQFNFIIVEYEDQIAGLTALQTNDIEGFITSGGGIEQEFIYNYDQVKLLLSIDDLTSDMTLATLKKDRILNDILSKVIANHLDDEIKDYVENAEILFNRKVLNLTDKELDYLEENNEVTVGVVSDYLPFDYYNNGIYQGVAGELINEISNIIGIKFIYDYGDFDTIYERALKGEVDVINIAKTEERLDKFIFPRSFSKERDIIYGEKKSEYISDIYGLENKTVAVIKGFWHEAFLKKNLRNVKVVITESIQESLKLVNNGTVDYFIENPTVTEYYISGLGYWNIVKKGETSQDSFLYFGINKSETELASIIDKTLQIIDYDIVKQRGLDTVPSLTSRSVTYLIRIVSLLVIAMTVIVWILVRSIKTLIHEREEKAILKEREQMMYIDPLTGLYNRLYFNVLEEKMDDLPFPQSIIVSDLNHLKNINDTLGHHMGDAYIKGYGHVLSDVCREAIVCRMGGDEFFIILTDCDANCAEKIVDEIIKRAKTEKITYDNQIIENLDAAVGYAVRFDANESVEATSIMADNMMYAHKKKMKMMD